METVIPRTSLGRQNLSVSVLSFGAAGIGNLYREVSEEDAEAALGESLDAGVNYFDTAPHYGLGLSEQRLGGFLRARSHNDVVVSTKVGRLLRPNTEWSGESDTEGFAVPASIHRIKDYSYDGTLRSIEESLERLGLGRIDIAFVHDPDDHETEALEGAFVALERLRSEGVIKSYGAGMNQSPMLARFIQRTELDVVMVAGRFSLLDQSALADLLPLAHQRDVSVVVAGVFNSGILARDTPAKEAKYEYSQASREAIERATELARLCAQAGFTLPQAAAQFPLIHPAVKVVCVGARNGEQARRNVQLFENSIPQAFFQELARAGLINLPAELY